MATKKAPPVPTVSVPAPLLTRACALLGELPAKHSGHVYVELLALKVNEENAKPGRPTPPK